MFNIYYSILKYLRSRLVIKANKAPVSIVIKINKLKFIKP